MTELASDYLDNTLPLHRRIAVRLHLSICAACDAYYEQMRKTVALLRGMEPAPPPPEVEERVLAAIGGTPPEPPAE